MFKGLGRIVGQMCFIKVLMLGDWVEKEVISDIIKVEIFLKELEFLKIQESILLQVLELVDIVS